MKKTLFFAAALLAVVACNKNNSVPEGKPVSMKIEINGSAPELKSTGNTDGNEALVHNLQLFVFAGDVRDGYASVASSTTAQVNCTTGSRDIYAVVNGPDLSSVMTKTAFLAAKSNLVDNSLENFVMIGSKTENIVADGTVDMNVNRLCARVVIRKITNDLAAGLNEKEFKVLAIYVTNVQGSNNYAGTGFQGSDDLWYNKMGHDEALTEKAATLLVDVPAEPISIAYKGSAATEYRYYPYPNNFTGADINGGDWSARPTRLVIEASIGGEVCYYVINMNTPLLANYSYEINNLTITRQGTDNPDTPVKSGSVTFNITVNPWTVVLLGDGEGNITL